MAATIGEQLRLAREARGIALREICDQTRISVHYLEAIEANDYKRLPGGVFNRSFIKAYAKYIGFNEHEAVEGYTRYLREHGDEAADEVNTHPMHSKVYTDTPATRSPVLTVVLAILILAILTAARSEEHTSELQSRRDLVCRLLLEKKKPASIRPSRTGMPLCNCTP